MFGSASGCASVPETATQENPKGRRNRKGVDIMGRSIAAIVVAWLLWSALWVGGSAALQSLFPQALGGGPPVTHAVGLGALIVWSVVLSILAGFVCAWVKKTSPMETVWALAAIQFVIATVIEVSGWANTPVWYHVLFLALLVPATVWGGKLRTGGLKDPA
jgi:pheromone shutdown protein TraB